MLIGATLCYIDNGQALLLLHRNKKMNDIHEGKWIGVGGRMELGESPEDCVIREVFEETGLNITSPTLRGILTFPEFDGHNDWLVFIYMATQFQGDLINCSEGTLEWVPYAQVLSKPTWEGDQLFLSWLMENRPFFSGKFHYIDSQLVEKTVVFYS